MFAVLVLGANNFNYVIVNGWSKISMKVRKINAKGTLIKKERNLLKIFDLVNQESLSNW